MTGSSPFVAQEIALVSGHGLRLFRILLADLSTQLSFQNRQLRFDLLLCFALLDDLFAVAAAEIVDGLNSNPNRASRLVLVEIFEAEIWGPGFFDDSFDHTVDWSIVAAFEAGNLQRHKVRMTRCKFCGPDLVIRTARIGVLPGIGDIERAADNSRA